MPRSPNVEALRKLVAPLIESFDKIQEEAFALADAAMDKDEDHWRSYHVAIEVLSEKLDVFRLKPKK